MTLLSRSMMRKTERRRGTVCLAAAIFLTCFLAQTVDCYRLRKTQRREERKDVDPPTIGVREGDIVFGKVSDEESALKDEIKKPSNSSVEDDTAYQADWTGQVQDTIVKEAAWARMSPSLLCGVDQMRFRAVGPGASQLALLQGSAPPVLVSQVPPSCGYTLNSNSMQLLMLVPYDGCNVVHQGGGFTLSMLWQGVPVSLRCTKPADPGQIVPQKVVGPPVYPDTSNPQFLPPYTMYPHEQYPHYPSVVPPKPGTPGPADPGQIVPQKAVDPPTYPMVPSMDPDQSKPQFLPPYMMYPRYEPYPQYPSVVPAKPGTPGPADPGQIVPQKAVDPPTYPMVPSKDPDASKPQFLPPYMMYPHYDPYPQYPSVVPAKPGTPGPADPGQIVPQKAVDPPTYPMVPSKDPDASKPQFLPPYMMYPHYEPYPQYPSVVPAKPGTPGPADPGQIVPQKAVDPPTYPMVPSKDPDASKPQFLPPYMMYPHEPYPLYPSAVSPKIPDGSQVQQYPFYVPTADEQVAVTPPLFPPQIPMLPSLPWSPAQFPPYLQVPGKPTTTQTVTKPKLPQNPNFVPPHLVPAYPPYPSDPTSQTIQSPAEPVPAPSHHHHFNGGPFQYPSLPFSS
ncbi:adhesive plaque matrix protein [Mugil cephalus]|uniref:adhesive plaque matrix protein n=1 Tax=Mugil cephalus TaxID=48193 RepID=UPI001FB62634|nr:adhesive plaque matrix protein [Mugil cephalus]